ncbi:ABC transporter ATP-binding protein [Luteococcus sp. Sow4_B9]|uniref:ABC transporter ATP-binding protein n=1 Tax=Luteococcus sp. Sow4_B9 TaxID=3438792 RepID=UPI003F9647C7
MAAATPASTTPPGSGQPAAPLVSGQQVTKSFAVGTRQVQILHGVDVAVTPGELVAIMGQSGSGKSTLLYCLAGLETPTSGEVTIDGTPLGRLNRADLARMRRSTVGFVFQQYNLVPTLSAYENVALPWRLNRQKPDRDMIMARMAAMGIADLATKLPNTLSGGEQQRVALARVLAQQPRIVFADEPTGALDTRTGKLVLDEIEDIAHNPDQCVLMVTHDPVVASRCDRVLFMRDGLLVQEIQRPDRDQVAETLNQLVEA